MNSTFQTTLGHGPVASMTSPSDLNLYEAVKTWIQLLCQHITGTCTGSLPDKLIEDNHAFHLEIDIDCDNTAIALETLV